jgi:hypothetical protein
MPSPTHRLNEVRLSRRATGQFAAEIGTVLLRHTDCAAQFSPQRSQRRIIWAWASAPRSRLSQGGFKRVEV